MDGPEPQFQYPRRSHKGKRAHPHAPRTLTLSSEPDAVLTVPKEFLPVMIGAGGRNICLVVKYAQVFVQSNEEGQVHLPSPVWAFDHANHPFFFLDRCRCLPKTQTAASLWPSA